MEPALREAAARASGRDTGYDRTSCVCVCVSESSNQNKKKSSKTTTDSVSAVIPMHNMQCSQPRDSSVDKEWVTTCEDHKSRQHIFIPFLVVQKRVSVEPEAKKGNNLTFSLLDWLQKLLDFQKQKHREIIKLFWHHWTFIILRSMLCEASWVEIWKLLWCSFITWTINMSELWLCFNCCILSV